ncbi:ATP-binding protein [Metamycoplasma hyosynoviae]|nr:ATP-binding protein [Metamycoplasma hyosynoviae]MDD7897925.1 ATP-binding protein [Metamycoplasma hyosynoviae]
MEIKRDLYLNKLIERMNNGQTKIITGIRRCGKSYLLNNIFYRYLIQNEIKKDHIILIYFENIENEELLNYKKLYEYVKEKIVDNEMYYLFIDEVQKVDNFIAVLNSLRKFENLDIYVTGSNSKFLSSDIATEFRGRGDQIKLCPLTFVEYFESSNLDFNDAFNEYLNYGGMPFLINEPSDINKINYLNNLYNEIYLKDIKERYKLKNNNNLTSILDFIASNIGSLTNPVKLNNAFKLILNVEISKNTIDNYLNILEDSFLIKRAIRFNIKGKKYINTPYKFYFTDIGLRNARLNFRQIEENHLMENIIFNELIARNYLMDVGVAEINELNKTNTYSKKQHEIDFVASMGNKKIYIQSCYSMSTNEKIIQEIKPLINTQDFFKKIIIVNDDIKSKIDEYGIITISIKEFLLNKDII